MIKQIQVCVLISKNYLEVSASENVGNSLINLFNNKIDFSFLDFVNSTNDEKNKSTEVSEFIKESINKIKLLTQTKIENVNLILDDFSIPSSAFSVESKIFEEKFEFKNPTLLNFEQYNEFYKITTNKLIKMYKKNPSKLVSLVPFRFYVIEDDLEKEQIHSKFPCGKTVKNIRCLFSIRTISKDIYDNIQKLFTLTNVAFNSVLLSSQLSPHKFHLDVAEKLVFTFDIQEEKSMLITSIDKVVVVSDELKYSFNDLVLKFCEKFDISQNEAINIINVYGAINATNLEQLNDIVHLTHDDSHIIRKKDVISIIKSFMKTLSEEVRDIIKSKSSNFNTNFDVNIVGKLEKIKDIEKYCSNYLGTKNVLSNIEEKNETFSFFNHNLVQKSLIRFLDVLKNKIKPLLSFEDKIVKPTTINIFNKKPARKKFIETSLQSDVV